MSRTTRTARLLTSLAVSGAVLVACSADPDSTDNSPSAGAPGALAGAPGGLAGAASTAGGASGGASPNGGSPGSTNGGGPGAAGTSPGGSEVELGRINVTVTAPTGTAPGAVTFIGKFYDGLYPSPTTWEVAETNGDCKLLTPVYPFCDPGCGTGVCIGENQCLAYPKLVNVGTLTVDGLSSATAGPINVEPLSPNNLTYQPKASAGLMYPGVTPGTPLKVSAKDGALGAFQVQADGILPFELVDGNAAIRVAPDEPTHLEWVPQPGDTTRVTIELDISHHGGIKGQVVCEVPDTGAFDVPGDLITKLIGLGVAGFPTVIVTRVSSSISPVGTGNGHVILWISSRVDHPVEIPGLVSCEGDAQCPEGQTCQQDKQCK